MFINLGHKVELTKRPVNVARQVATTTISWNQNFQNTSNLVEYHSINQKTFTTGITEKSYLTVYDSV